MITLDNDTLILDRTQENAAILPLVLRVKGKDKGWYIDLGLEDRAVVNWLIDAEILGEPFAIRYIAVNGQTAEAKAVVDELICGPDGDMSRLRGEGAPPAALLGDEPKVV